MKVSAPVLESYQHPPAPVHIPSQHLSGALPEPLHFLSLRMTTSYPMIGPYQTPTSPTKTDQLKENKQRQKNGATFLTGVALLQPQPTNEKQTFIFFKPRKSCSPTHWHVLDLKWPEISSPVSKRIN